ncbi:hypothetical protein JVU11DRAFT_9064 [Chiua virens]|nr:hypothetical protein JVU11DRAFT_9064 [Chiua virens]
MKKLTGRNFVCETLRFYFPACAERFQRAVDYWAEVNVGKPEQKVEAQFGLFFNFCPNVPLPGGRVHTVPHADRKNVPGGLCALLTYHKNRSFNSKEKAWLAIWELEVILELPVGVLLLYPSALFYHFNVDISDMIIQSSDQPHVSERENYSKWDCSSQGRGSLVWFNQASMIQSAELGYNSIKQAQAAGLETTTNFEEDVNTYFKPSTQFVLPSCDLVK